MIKKQRILKNQLVQGVSFKVKKTKFINVYNTEYLVVVHILYTTPVAY